MKRNQRNQTVNVISTVALVTLFAKLLGIVRESLQARAFGSQAAADLYTTANNTTIYLFTTVAYALCIAAVPILTPRLRRDRREGCAAACNLITITVLLSVLAAAGWIAATFTPWVGSLWEGSAQETAQLASYIRIMALTLPVIVLTYLLVAFFQSLEHFVLQGSMSIPYNLALILFLVLFAGRLGVGGYVAAVALAWLLQLAMTAPYAVRERFLLRPALDLRADYVRTFLKTAVVTVLTTSIFLFCYLQDSGMTAQLPGSPVSAFYYADKLFTPLTTTLIYSISTVLFPKFSQEYASTDRATYLRYIWNVLRSTSRAAILARILPPPPARSSPFMPCPWRASAPWICSARHTTPWKRPWSPCWSTAVSWCVTGSSTACWGPAGAGRAWPPPQPSPSPPGASSWHSCCCGAQAPSTPRSWRKACWLPSRWAACCMAPPACFSAAWRER